MRNKLGLIDQKPGDMELINDLLAMLKENRADYTNTFVALTLDEYDDMDLFEKEEFKLWHKRWKERIKDDSIESIKEMMKANNPYIIPRNHKVEEALTLAIDGDYSLFNDFSKALKNPYAYREEQEKYAKIPPIPTTPYKTFCGT